MSIVNGKAGVMNMPTSTDDSNSDTEDKHRELVEHSDKVPDVYLPISSRRISKFSKQMLASPCLLDLSCMSVDVQSCGCASPAFSIGGEGFLASLFDE